MSDDEEKQEKRGFKVEDRRRFSESGETRSEAPDSQHTGTSAATAAPAAEDTAPPRSADPSPMDLNFSTFVISLSTQALAHLGEIEDPITRGRTLDLGAAKQLIDILGILKDKTKGNLDTMEAELLDKMLYDLRLCYVERVRSRSDKA